MVFNISFFTFTHLRKFHFSVLSISLIICCTSCLRPLEGDFPIHGQGLSDDELLWVLRIPVSPAEGDLGPVSSEDSVQFAEYNQPFFQNALQTILKRVLNGDIPAFEEYPAKTVLENPRERLLQIGGSSQNIDPLLKVVELYVVLNTKQKSYQAQPRYLRLIWTNPDGRETDRGFAGLDLAGDWAKEIMIGEQNLQEFAMEEKFFALPVYLRTNFREYAIQSAEEAKYVYRMVREGNWKYIEWAADGINTSGKTQITLKPETIIPLGGFYQFPVSKNIDSAKVQELFLTAENDYLIADWGNRFKIEKILPYGKFEFFSNSGELYEFFAGDDERLYLRVIQKKDTLLGVKLDDE